MKLFLLPLVLLPSLAVSASAEALALSPPSWEIHDLCKMHDNDTCLGEENEARLGVLGRWATVPEADRAACMKRVDRDGHRSYRALADCFDDRAMKALEAGPPPKK